MPRKIGIALIVLCYALLLYFSLSSPAYAHAHPHLDATRLAQYASPWPVALGSALALAGITLAVIPIRRGERWALFTSLAVLIILFATRMSTDPRCLVVLDPHQHGCHTFVIAMILGLAGLALAGFSRQPHRGALKILGLGFQITRFCCSLSLVPPFPGFQLSTKY